MNMRSYWETKVEENPQKIFLYYEDQEVRYDEFDARVNQIAHGLLDMGVKKGDRVCLMLPNVPEFLYSWFGICKIGGVMVPINTAFKTHEAQYVVNHSESNGLIVFRDYLQIALEIQRDCPHLKWIACVDGNDLPKGVISYDQLPDRMPKELKDFRLKDEDLACVIYTSGTTGFPKGVMRSHKDPPMTGEAFLLRAGVGPTDRLMAIMPLFHINAQFYSTWGAIAAEASLILIRRFSASRFWDQAVQYGATEFNFPLAVGKILCARSEKEFRPEHSIRTAVGVAVTPDVYKAFTKRFMIPHVIDAYGLTEVPAVCENPIGGLVKMKSIGLPAKHPTLSPFAELKVVDEEGREAPTGKMGELLVRSPLVMKGYFRDPEKTKEAFCEGWFCTGDYVYKDEDGYFFFVDRKKDIIRRRGENISAAEVEAAITENQKVLEAAVIAVPSEIGEDEVMACVVLKPDQSMTPEELIDWCRGQLADFKVPRFIQFRKYLPKTSTEKVAKLSLKKQKELITRACDMESYKKSSI